MPATALDKNLVMLQDDFRDKVVKLLDNCANRNVIMKPYMGTRSAQWQAELWCRSRTDDEKTKMVNFLRNNNADFLADCLLKVTTVGNDRWATNAVSGRSWHNWGYAVDCVNVHGGIANWDSNTDAYNVYAEEAEKLGLTSGHRWKKKDSVHVQFYGNDQLQEYSWYEINNEMKKRWGNGITS